MPIVTDRLTKLTIDKKVIENQELAEELDQLAKGVHAVIERVGLWEHRYSKFRLIEQLTEVRNTLWDMATIVDHSKPAPKRRDKT